MDVVALMLIPCVGYIIAYRTYGKYVAKKIFKLHDEERTPAHTFEDGCDFVPTPKGIVFGHHYTSIAGTGPIVGPAIGIIWGWVPALLWVFIGSIVMGAVHDFGILVLSMRNEGKSIAQIAARYIHPRVRYIFFLIVFLALLIVIAIFGLVIAITFSLFPEAVFPVWMQIPIALLLGLVIHKKKNTIVIATAGAVCLMYATIMVGTSIPLTMPSVAFIPATGVWMLLLLAYVFIASVIPVTTLLQPRDYINAWQLFIVMGLIMLGAFFSSLTTDIAIVAPACNFRPEGAPPLFPFLFITIACGAISGFHALVSSGTSAKQIARAQDAYAIGYGAMLMESALAVLIIVAVSAGIGLGYESQGGGMLYGHDAWGAHYFSWSASQGLASKISAVVIGSANMMQALGVPQAFGIVIMGVFIASFAGTTLDTATRIQRYVVSELCTQMRISWMANKYVATGFAVVTAALLAFITGADGKGALILWPMFGGINQLLAALALILLTVYLKRKRTWGVALTTGIPALFMLIITLWGAGSNEWMFICDKLWLLVVINGGILILALWLCIESVIVLLRRNNP